MTGNGSQAMVRPLNVLWVVTMGIACLGAAAAQSPDERPTRGGASLENCAAIFAEQQSEPFMEADGDELCESLLGTATRLAYRLPVRSEAIRTISDADLLMATLALVAWRYDANQFSDAAEGALIILADMRSRNVGNAQGSHSLELSIVTVFAVQMLQGGCAFASEEGFCDQLQEHDQMNRQEYERLDEMFEASISGASIQCLARLQLLGLSLNATRESELFPICVSRFE